MRLHKLPRLKLPGKLDHVGIELRHMLDAHGRVGEYMVVQPLAVKFRPVGDPVHGGALIGDQDVLGKLEVVPVTIHIALHPGDVLRYRHGEMDAVLQKHRDVLLAVEALVHHQGDLRHAQFPQHGRECGQG